MKKFFSIAIMLMAVMAAGAQTDFRHISLDEAAKAAKAEGKLIFIDVYTSWCGPCKMMANQTFPQKLVGDYMNKTFVCVKFDAEKGEGVDVAKLFDVKAYPTFIVATADKTELNRVLGYYEGPKFVEKLQQCVNPKILQPYSVNAMLTENARRKSLRDSLSSSTTTCAQCIRAQNETH